MKNRDDGASLSQEQLYQDLTNAVLSYDADKLTELAKKALAQGQDPNKITENGLIPPLRIVGKKFEDGEFFLVDLIAARRHR